jgi:hypothetical protein
MRPNRLTYAFIVLLAALCTACVVVLFTVDAPVSPNIQSAFATSTATAGVR